MKKSILMSTILLSFIAACKKDSKCGCIVLDTNSEIRVINSGGQNLLNAETPNSFKKEEIKLYYLVDGQKKEVLNGGIDAPRNFMIFQIENHSQNYANEYLIRVFANDKGVKDTNGIETTTSYIEWNKADTDTIVCQIRKPGASVFCDKVWYNGVIKWDITSNPKVEDKSFPGRFFQIIK